MDNKETDKLFQEHLGDYREQPDPEVWDRIRSSLDSRKKKTRVIPLWWRWGAAAAVFLIALFLTVPWDSRDAELPAVSATKQELTDSPADGNADNPTTQDPATTQDTPVEIVDRNDGDPEESREMPAQQVEESVAEAGNGNTSGRALGKATAIPDASQDGKSGAGELQSPPLVSPTGPEALASTDETQPETVADQPADKRVVMNTGQTAEEGPTEGPSDGKKSIFDEIEAAEAFAEEETDKDEKWSLGPIVAPVYFNSFGEGSPIASNFVNNSKSGSFNMSYGLQVSYKVSRKLRIRSGVHRVDYGYNTEDVGFTSAPTARPSSLIRTISYSEESKSLVVQSMVDNPAPMEPGAVDVTAPSPARRGQMVQEFGYLEVPLEMQFSLIDKKFGVDLIGGMSSLFLIDNSVSLESGDSVTEVGEATNMNSMNFSTNFGLGFFYRLNQSFELNLQPMFKYQLNTFSQTSGNFNPYSVGIYSGLSFRF